jgi:uncharacterized repeat protein (TIGR01451 family)
MKLVTNATWKIALCMTVILTLGAFLLWAVHNLEFQLDADIVQAPPSNIGGTTQYVDWGDSEPGVPDNYHIFDAVGGVGVPADVAANFPRAVFVRDFVPGASGPDNTTFATGSKDTLNITPGWQCAKDNNVNDKTDIVNAYATAYRDPGTSHTIAYFALERYSNEGAGNVGFWFLQDGTVGCVSPNGSVAFTGNHMDGDILIVSEFTNGGVISSIIAYKWVGGAGGYLDPTPLVIGADCDTINPLDPDSLCANVNQSLIPASAIPWLTETKKPGPNPSNDLDTSEFFEGGIDLTDLGLGDQCFSTFLGVTRSSPSLTATIFDYALGGIDLCALDVTKTGDTLGKIGDEVSYSITITNTGVITLYKKSIVDDVLGDLTDGTNAVIDSSDCGASLAPSASCTITASYLITGSDPDPLVNTVVATYNSKSDLTGQDVAESDDHSVNLFQPAVQVDKSVAPELSKIGDDVTYSFTITNNSSSDSPDLILDSVSDDVLGDLAGDAPSSCDQLAPGDSCSFDVDYTIQGDDPDPLVNIVTVHYHPSGFPNDISDTDTASVNLFQVSVNIDKTGDALSKVGDDVNYTITVTNTSSGDSPDLTCSISDPMLSVSKTGVSLGPGGTDVTNATYTVQQGDPDPLENTASVTCTVDGYGNTVGPVTDSHSVNLFQPSVEIIKSGPGFSKVGDQVTYDFTINNTSSADSPDLKLDSISDDVLGNLATAAGNAGCGTLAPAGSCNFTVDYTILETDPDPLVNTVTVHYHPDGFPNDITDSDDHTVDLFTPDFTISKTGDTISKIGDQVTYTFTVTNTSSSDSPVLNLVSFSDNKIGDLSTDAANAGCDVLSISEVCSFNVNFTIPGDAADPFDNEVTVTYQVAGFPNQITHSDTHSVNLFQPAIQVTKGGDTLSKVGDTVTYTFRIDNNSSGDSPDLVLDSVSDTVLGDLAGDAPSACDQLASGAYCEFTVDYTIQGDDPDPLDNTVTVHYHPVGFTNDITDDDDHSVNLFQPSVSIDKSGDALSKVGDPVDYTITVTNTSSSDSPDLTCDISDALLGINKTGVSLAPGDSDVTNASRTVQQGDPDPLPNTASVTCTVVGFGNVIGPETDTHNVNLFQPSVMVTKGGPATASVGDTVTYSFTITNNGSGDSPNLILDSVSDTLLGDLTATAAANACSSLAPAGSCNFTFDYTIQLGDPDPLPNTVTVHYHPDGFPNDIYDSDNHSIDLVELFEGCTPGYWKNHPAAWAEAGINPATLVGSVFNNPAAGVNQNPYTNGSDPGDMSAYSLIQGLSFQGGDNTKGAAQILLRAGIASLLNASHPDVDFTLSPSDVITSVSAALNTKDRATIIGLASQLDYANNGVCEVSPQ